MTFFMKGEITMILYTADRLAGFIARRTGPAHSGLAPAPQTNYHHRHSNPGPI
jgi:hypothetical protein